ncbi:MAG TPA: nuclear transport factor 2 family protein [Actinomycetota bacterium]|nr:nuclear transport factor 2 family protein [Actinomycetota bacterium]
MSTQSDDIEGFLAEWTAAERSGDAAALDKLLADDFTGVGPLGFTLSKQDWLDRHAAGDLTYRTFDLADIAVRRYGDTAVVITRQSAAGAYRGHEVPGDLRVTLVVTDASGSGQLAGAHMSFIAGTPGAPPVPGRP